MNTMIYDNSRTELAQTLKNPLHYYEALARGESVDTTIWGRPTFKPSLEARAEAIAKQQWEYLQTPMRNGTAAGVSSAISQFRFDVMLLKTKNDSRLGEVAAIGRAAMLQENLLMILKTVKKLSPTQKARKEHGYNGKDYDTMFNTVTLHFVRTSAGFGWLHIEMAIIDTDGTIGRISLARDISGKVETASFSVSLDWTTLLEVVKTLNSERIDMQYRDWIGKFVMKQGRSTSRLVLK